MRIKIIEDPFDHVLSYGQNYNLSVWSGYHYVFARLSIVNYRVIKAPVVSNNDLENYKRGNIITRKELYLLSL